MVDTGLCELIPPVKVIAEDVVVEHSSKPHTDPIGNIQKLIPADVGQHPQPSENAGPLADLQRVGLKHQFLRDLADPELHERVDVSVNVGQVHEGSSMQQSNDPAVRVLLDLRPADSPKPLVLIPKFKAGVGLRGEAILRCL